MAAIFFNLFRIPRWSFFVRLDSVRWNTGLFKSSLTVSTSLPDVISYAFPTHPDRFPQEDFFSAHSMAWFSVFSTSGVWSHFHCPEQSGPPWSARRPGPTRLTPPFGRRIFCQERSGRCCRQFWWHPSCASIICKLRPDSWIFRFFGRFVEFLLRLTVRCPGRSIGPWSIPPLFLPHRMPPPRQAGVVRADVVRQRIMVRCRPWLSSKHPGHLDPNNHAGPHGESLKGIKP